MNLVVLVGWLLLRIESATATQCLSCAPMPSSVPCSTFTNCQSGQECYAKYVMKPNGTVLYEFGCHNSQTCPDQMGTHALIGKRATGDNVLCYKCCQQDMCNQGTLCSATISTLSPSTTSSTTTGLAPTTPANPCSPSPCVHGSCFISNTNPPTFFCLCPNSFEGVQCEKMITSTASTTTQTLPKTNDPNLCSGSPCLHGNCFSGSADYFCQCEQGWQGTHCDQHLNLCSGSPCLHGKCFSGSADYFCQCEHGWQGKNCDQIEGPCGRSPCVHGNCFESSSDYVCQCENGWNGKNCDQVDGRWGSWTTWSVCTSYCNQTRTRTCDNPAPLYGGRDCPGLTMHTQGCSTSECQVDGQWGSWTTWSVCTSYCNQTRIRTCDNPAPLHGGRDCPGLTMQTQGCSKSECQVKDCSELLSSGTARLSGVYIITTPITHTKIQVYCDMVTDGGGWTIFQKRFDGSEDFYRNFSDYANGFGSVNAEHWLGLKYIYEITSSGSYQLRVAITYTNGSKGYDVYDNFSLQPGTSYTMNLGRRLQLSGIEPDVSLNNNQSSGSAAGCAFSTYGHDVDENPSGSCAIRHHGGWWYNHCVNMNLNGLFRPGENRLDSMRLAYGVGLLGSTMMFKRA